MTIKGMGPDTPTTINERGGGQSALEYRFDLIDARAMFAMAEVLHTGAEKYGEDNWRKIDVRDHLNHMIAHAYAYIAGDTSDDHLSHVLCRATFALGVALEEPLHARPQTETERLHAELGHICDSGDAPNCGHNPCIAHGR